MPDTETEEAFLNIVSLCNRPWAEASYAQGSHGPGPRCFTNLLVSVFPLSLPMRAPLKAALTEPQRYYREFRHLVAFVNLDHICPAALPVRAPLKAALTGLELLLARAQLWEETAARHVSLKEVLQPIAALAGRWRKLELAAWHGLLDRTVDAFAEGEWTWNVYCERMG